MPWKVSRCPGILQRRAGCLGWRVLYTRYSGRTASGCANLLPMLTIDYSGCRNAVRKFRGGEGWMELPRVVKRRG